MAVFIYENFSDSFTASAILDTDTSLVVQSGDGIKFPSPGAGEEFRAVLEDAAGNREIIGVTSRSVDSFTVITRGLEGTLARDWPAGTLISHRLTAEILSAYQTPVVLDAPLEGATESPISANWAWEHSQVAEYPDPHPQYLIADHVDETPTEGAVGIPISSAYIYEMENRQSTLHIRDQRVAGVDGGSCADSAWQTRVLNTEIINDIPGAIFLGNDQFTLPAGRYRIDASAPARECGGHRLRLRDVTNSLTIRGGRSCHSSIGDDTVTHATLVGEFELADETLLELQHYTGNDHSSDGLGTAVSAGTMPEVYAEVLIWRL